MLCVCFWFARDQLFVGSRLRSVLHPSLLIPLRSVWAIVTAEVRLISVFCIFCVQDKHWAHEVRPWHVCSQKRLVLTVPFGFCSCINNNSCLCFWCILVWWLCATFIMEAKDVVLQGIAFTRSLFELAHFRFTEPNGEYSTLFEKRFLGNNKMCMWCCVIWLTSSQSTCLAHQQSRLNCMRHIFNRGFSWMVDSYLSAVDFMSLGLININVTQTISTSFFSP